jgi:hypothetical protein
VDHPRLGRLARTEYRWRGTAPLPTFAVCGTTLRRADDPPPGFIQVEIESLDGGIAAEQDAALDHLLDNEPAVFAAVWAELTPALSNYDQVSEVICTGVEVSQLHVGGVAYLGFSIDCAGHLEHGFQVVYHPSKGTWWGDWEALNAIEEADNLPPRPEE